MSLPPRIAGVLFLAAFSTCTPAEKNTGISSPVPTPSAVTSGSSDPNPDGSSTQDPDADGASSATEKKPLPPVAAADAPPAAPRAALAPGFEQPEALAAHIQNYFDNQREHRIYIQVDKPMYKPGEAIWVRTWHLEPRGLTAGGGSDLRYQLVSPKGVVVLEKRVAESAGRATNDFEIPDAAQGGEYLVRVIGADGHQAERPVIVSAYEAPRIKKKLEFLRKAYGPGDEVTASIEVKRPTGEVLAGQALKGAIWLDGRDLPPVTLTTDATGNGLVRFTLPKDISMGDGLLTVLIDDGGVTESVSKRIPIIVNRVTLQFYPEGGDLVAGLPSRLYFAGTSPLGKPADLEGRILDDRGSLVAAFKTYHQGLGRLDFTPLPGRQYVAQVTKPEGIAARYPLPAARPEGCAVMSYDDLDGQLPALRVGVRCTAARQVTVVGMLRERLLDAATVNVNAGVPAMVYLEPKDPALARAQGVARVTVFDDQRNPLAERLVYRNRRSGLNVRVTPDRSSYAPRDQVRLEVTTTGPDGKPVAADLGLSVVDDTVVSYADDKTGHILSRLYLEPEIPDKVEEPNFYFDQTDDKSAFSMDLLMGTRGWRRFDWAPVFYSPVAYAEGEMLEMGAVAGMAMPAGAVEEKAVVARPRMLAKANRAGAPIPPLPAAPMPAAPMPAAPPMNQPMPQEAPAVAPPAVAQLDARNELRAAGKLEALPAAKVKADAAPARRERAQNMADEKMIAPAQEAAKDMAASRDALFDGQDKEFDRLARKVAAVEIAPVRVFPAPVYNSHYDGPRTDFRETLYWLPNLATDERGHASVAFYLSDAVTSFRVFTEGVGGGAAGRNETVLKSSLPFSMSVKLPLEVSAGDQLELPLTLSNEGADTAPVALQADFGAQLTLARPVVDGALEVPGHARKSLFFPVNVTGVKGKSQVAFTASSGGLKDEFIREVNVVPLGFPAVIERSGQLEHTWTDTLDLSTATPGSVDAKIRIDPGPVSMMLSGLEGLLQQPNGCFEQTSSTNYPNVMVMRYLQDHGIADAALTQRSQKLLEDGYRKLTGYETPEKGYEWFGGAPGHEALTAYGLLEFTDMRRVYSDVDGAMITRTANWLRSRRDGKGGFQRNSRALDSFGAAPPEVTDAYITWSLSEAGATDLEPEIARQAELAKSTGDAYLLALAANTLYNVPARKSGARAAAKRLLSMQEQDGHWTSAGTSITRSSGVNLELETTSLALLALMRDPSLLGSAQSGIAWLASHRSGFGQWGATQATVLALRALTTWADLSKAAQGPGKVTVKVNGKVAGTFAYESGRREPIVFDDLARYFKAGKNTLELEHQGPQPLPFALAVEYRQLKPASSEQAAVEIATSLARDRVKLGETVRLTARVSNRTDQGQPMTLARVGLPGGLTFQNWQLKELKEKGLIAFYETRPREVILYFRDLQPKEQKEIPIDLIASVPGTYTAPASTAYLYYTDELKRWAPGLKVVIAP